MHYRLAIRPDADTRGRLAAIAERLRAWGLPARWVDPEDYHIAVCHLGRLDAAEQRALPWSVADVAASLLPGALTLPGLGASGGRREPATVYAAVGDPGRWCADVHLDLHDALGMRCPPHLLPQITLCRPFGGDADTVWPRLLEAHGQATWGPCDVDELCLLAFDPGAEVRRYRVVTAWPIDGRDARRA